jgi:hypothetical protein
MYTCFVATYIFNIKYVSIQLAAIQRDARKWMALETNIVIRYSKLSLLLKDKENTLICKQKSSVENFSHSES